MRVAFLNAFFGRDFTKSARWFARSRGRVQRHPDYLCTAAATTRAAGHEIFVLDAQAKNWPTDEALPRIRDFGPDLIVHQTSTPSIDSDIAAARACRDATDAITVLVGPHVTAEPEDTLARARGGVDALAIGEYDLTIRDLANGASVEECAGLAWSRDGQVVHNPSRPHIQDLDQLPFPAWEHIDIGDYRDAGKLFPFITLITGRGCWGRCTFCQLPQVMNGRRYRSRSMESVLAEIDYDLSLFPNLREIMFEDDTFVSSANRERVAAVCEGLLKKDCGLAWSANARADFDDPELFRLMKRSGCRMLCVGFEFGDQEVLDSVNKGVTIDRMYAFAETAYRAGLRIHGCFMFGGPGETLDTARKTIDLALGLKIDTAQFSGVVAYPGTEYYAWAKANGYLIPSQWRDWVDGSYEQCTTQALPELSSEQTNALIDEGLRRFYLRPRQMVRMLMKIRSMADVRAKLHGLRSFCGYFASGR